MREDPLLRAYRQPRGLQLAWVGHPAAPVRDHGQALVEFALVLADHPADRARDPRLRAGVQLQEQHHEHGEPGRAVRRGQRLRALRVGADARRHSGKPGHDQLHQDTRRQRRAHERRSQDRDPVARRGRVVLLPVQAARRACHAGTAVQVTVSATYQWLPFFSFGNTNITSTVTTRIATAWTAGTSSVCTCRAERLRADCRPGTAPARVCAWRRSKPADASRPRRRRRRAGDHPRRAAPRACRGRGGTRSRRIQRVRAAARHSRMRRTPRRLAARPRTCRSEAAPRAARCRVSMPGSATQIRTARPRRRRRRRHRCPPAEEHERRTATCSRTGPVAMRSRCFLRANGRLLFRLRRDSDVRGWAVAGIIAGPPPQISFAALNQSCNHHTLLVKDNGQLTVNNAIYVNSCSGTSG